MKKMKRTLLVLSMVVALVGFMAICNAHADPNLNYDLPGSTGSLSYNGSGGALVGGGGIVVDSVKGSGTTANNGVILDITSGALSFTTGNSTGSSTWGAGAAGSFTVMGSVAAGSNGTSFAGTNGNAGPTSGYLIYGQVLSARLENLAGTQYADLTVAIDTQDSTIAAFYGLPTTLPYIATTDMQIDLGSTTSGGAFNLSGTSLANGGSLVNTPVPEPASLLLYGVLLLGLGFVRRYCWKA